ncbi:MAG: peroxiredoxin family protein [Xanthomonadales bacterium]|nr:peroxiredoxin family protein [Xanthomonadales bacterium]MDH4019913.1 peroxiredoxin family protein [Xanthomonadales bacterium]
MNLLKSVFISAFVTWLTLLSLYAFSRLALGTEPLLSWLGLALTAFAPLVFFLKAFLFKSPRTPRHPVEYSVLSGLGLAITMATSFRYGQAAGEIHIWAGVTLLAWLAYLRWYSVFRSRDAESLRVGAKLPDFQLETLDGHTVSSESFMAKPHLLLFYRGNWCPFCTAQIEELAQTYQRLEKMGVSVVLISSQPISKNQALAARFDISMTFLRDRENAAAKQLGIEHSWGTPMGLQILGYESDSVMPTLIVTNAQGQIVFSDQTDNYRVRPEPDTIAALLSTPGSEN